MSVFLGTVEGQVCVYRIPSSGIIREDFVECFYGTVLYGILYLLAVLSSGFRLQPSLLLLASFPVVDYR